MSINVKERCSALKSYNELIEKYGKENLELEFVENYYGHEIYYFDGYFIVEDKVFESFNQAITHIGCK